MDHTLALMAIYRKTRLSLHEAAHVLNMSYNTAKKRRSDGTFPVPMAGSPLTADIADLGRYLQSLSQPQEETDDHERARRS